MSNGYESSFTCYINLTNIQVQILLPTAVIKNRLCYFCYSKFSRTKKISATKDEWSSVSFFALMPISKHRIITQEPLLSSCLAALTENSSYWHNS